MELATATYRLETLKEKKAIYFNATQPGSPKLKDISVSGSKTHDDPFLNYAAKVEDINKEIDILEKEIELLQIYLKKMENSLRNMKGILERIFVMKYIDGLKTSEISNKLHYSETHVYRLLNTIRTIVKESQ